MNSALVRKWECPESSVAARELARVLARPARQYFGYAETAAPRILLSKARQRLNSTLYEFEIECNSAKHHVMVKVPLGRASVPLPARPGQPPVAGRPRLFPRPDPSGKAELEFAAMRRIQQHFESLADDRFGSIRVFDYLPEYRAIVMEALGRPNLSRLLMRANRLQGCLVPTRLERACENAGAWLKSYHHLPALPHTETKQNRRENFLESLTSLGQFLGKTPGNRGFVESLQDRVRRAAERHLPLDLPLGMGHGDYAPRNMLVGPNDRVVVLDTLARWRAPIYHDIAHFLVALKTNRLQVASRGMLFDPATISTCEKHFLDGYFTGANLPCAPIRLFECLVALEKWAALVHGHAQSHGWQRVGKRCWLAGWASLMRRYLINLVAPFTR